MDTCLYIKKNGERCSKEQSDKIPGYCCYFHREKDSEKIAREAAKVAQKLDRGAKRTEQAAQRIAEQAEEQEEFLSTHRPDEKTQLRLQAIRDYCETNDAKKFPIGKRTAFYNLINGEWWGFESVKEFTPFYEKLMKAHDRDPRHFDYVSDDYFADLGRARYGSTGSESVEEALETRLSFFELDRWKDQSVVPMILCEKEGHGPVLERITDPAQVILHTSKGTFSRSQIKSIAKDISDIVSSNTSASARRKVAIGYVGDFDAAGVIRIEECARNGNPEGKKKGIRDLLMRDYALEMDEHVTWERVLLTEEQFKSLNPKKLVHLKDGSTDSDGVKRAEDTCAPQFRARYGEWCAEVEALNANTQRERVQAFIDKHFDEALYEQTKVESLRQKIEGEELLTWFPVIRTLDSFKDKMSERLNEALSEGI
jgi:hypothetical protein